MRVSICMCSYKRANLLRETMKSIRAQNYPDLEVIVCEDGFDGGWTREVCKEFGVRYFQRTRRPESPYSNPAIPWNVAIKNATGEILILQNPECRHEELDTIEKLVAPHRDNKDIAVFATVKALLPNGQFQIWYCHPEYSRRPLFFCGSVPRSAVEKVGGFDEEFLHYGFDDDFFAFCLNELGIKFLWRDDVPVAHQWHEVATAFGLDSNRLLYERKVRDLMERRTSLPVNAGREWGRTDS